MFKKRKVARTAGRSAEIEEEDRDQYKVAKAPAVKVLVGQEPSSRPTPPSVAGTNRKELDVKEPVEINQTGIYKGLKKSNRYGPISASESIRSTVFTDYQPDVCKDYKQTGYCGYGDSCKFLHIRENYAAGWQLDEIKPKPRPAHKIEATLATTKQDKNICGICSSQPNIPVKTRCGHLFCEQCFLTRNKKTASCAVCGKDTDGIIKRIK